MSAQQEVLWVAFVVAQVAGLWGDQQFVLDG